MYGTRIFVALFLASWVFVPPPSEAQFGKTLKDRLKREADKVTNPGQPVPAPNPSTLPSSTGHVPYDQRPQGQAYPPNRSPRSLTDKPVQPDVIEADGKRYYTMATFRIDLFAMRRKPELITDEFLYEFASRQLSGENGTWKGWYTGLGGRPATPRIPPETWAWQTLIDQQPDFAKGPLLDVFLNPQTEWSFVKTKNKENTPIEAFLFARDKIEGRDESFVARELQPVVKKQLILASARAPTSLWMPVKLPYWDWDPASNSIRFLKGSPGTPFEERVTLMTPVHAGDIVYPRVPHPAEYPTYYYSPTITNDQKPVTVKPGQYASAYSPTAWWRDESFAGANGKGHFPLFYALALDHKAEVSAVPVPVAQAEQMHQAHLQLSARMLFELQDTAIADTKAEQNGHPSLCVYAKLKQIEIVGTDGSVVSSIDGASLPVGSTMPEPVTSVPHRTRPNANATAFTDDMRKTGQENQRRAQESAAASRARTQQRLHDIRIRNCATFAAHRFPDTDSPEYQKANDDCVQRVNAQEAGQAQ
jgi:hypothetical protein